MIFFCVSLCLDLVFIVCVYYVTVIALSHHVSVVMCFVHIIIIIIIIYTTAVSVIWCKRERSCQNAQKERRGVENEWKRVKDNQKESKQAIPVSKRDRATPHNLPRNLPNPNPNQTTWRRLLHTWVIWFDSFLRSFTRSQAQPPLGGDLT